MHCSGKRFFDVDLDELDNSVNDEHIFRQIKESNLGDTFVRMALGLYSESLRNLTNDPVAVVDSEDDEDVNDKDNKDNDSIMASLSCAETVKTPMNSPVPENVSPRGDEPIENRIQAEVKNYLSLG
mmetsp:Transcript_25580/g.30951  ORF Transcript_25580/g.30951 Transcript_25580/m.30951 type:complete len:126 (-) Transcript_25580:478-855(-)